MLRSAEQVLALQPDAAVLASAWTSAWWGRAQGRRSGRE